MTSFAAVPPVPAPVAALAQPDRAPTAPTVLPDLGTAAVTATAAGRALRHDPSRHDAPPGPPADPAPLKGLGIPPLNTRHVGDFDKIDDPPTPMGLDLPARLSDLEPAPAPSVDLRR